MRHLTKREKALWNTVPDDNCLQSDYPRRLRNALKVLIDLDPHWMTYLDQAIWPGTPLQQATRLVEYRARALLLHRYDFFGHDNIGHLIFREDWLFTDGGNLRTG